MLQILESADQVINNYLVYVKAYNSKIWGGD